MTKLVALSYVINLIDKTHMNTSFVKLYPNASKRLAREAYHIYVDPSY
jgi:hypothetical protein